MTHSFGPAMLAFMGATCAFATTSSDAAELVSAAASTALLPPDGASHGNHSRDGRFVAVGSDAANLVAGDSNGFTDVYLVDRNTGARSLVSQAGGTPANGRSVTPAVSNDGRYVAFVSEASNLVPGDSNGVPDVFFKDLQTGTLERLASFGVVPNSWPAFLELSEDASILTFVASAANWVPGATTGSALLRVRWNLQQVNAIATDFPMAYAVDVSGDARCMVYRTDGFPSRGRLHVFLTGAEQWVDTPAGGGEPNGTTGDVNIDDACTYVAFESSATNLLPEVAEAGHAYRRNLATGMLEWVSRRENPEPFSFGQVLSMSGDGRHLSVQRRVMSGSGPYTAIWTEYRDMTQPFSVRANWLQSGYVGMADGGVAFEWTVDERVGDLNGYYDLHVSAAPGALSQAVLGPAGPTPALAANGESQVASVRARSESQDGRWVFFDSLASNLGPPGADSVREVFVRDRSLQQTFPAFELPGGAQPNGDSFLRDVSADGRFVLFGSCASNLVAGDSNGSCDLFLADRSTGSFERVNVSSSGQQADEDFVGTRAQVTDDGRYVVFESFASNLAPIALGRPQVYIRDRVAATTSLALQSGMPPNGQSRLLDLAEAAGYLMLENRAFDATPNCRLIGIELSTGQRTCPLLDDAGVPIVGPNSSSLSSDGRFLAAIDSGVSGLVLHLRDRQMGRTRRIELAGLTDTQGGYALSGNGRYLAILSLHSYHYEGKSDYRASVFDTILGSWVIAPADALSHVHSLNPGKAGDHLILSTASILDAADLNGHVPDVYRTNISGVGLFGGGWQGGFE